MTVSISAIRFGAPTAFLVGAQDMGATKGGVICKISRTQVLIECDQFLAPVATFVSKEEGSVDSDFYESKAAKWTYILGLQGLGNVVTTPGSPNTDVFSFGGQVQVATATLDLTIPKNDGTTNTWAVHYNKVHGFKELQTAWTRDKEVTYKGTFNALADTTKAAGLQVATFTEQY